MVQRAAFASGVPPNIYEFHLYTRNSTLLSHTLFLQFEMRFLGWAQGFNTPLKKTPTHPLRPVIPNNARSLCITAAAGTELAGPSYLTNVIILVSERTLRPEGLLRSRGIAGSGFPPLSNIPYCCLP